MKKEFFRSRTISAVILFLGTAMIYYGKIHGEVEVVLNKAIRICMECIGIG